MDEVRDFDDLLTHLGSWGKFQIILTVHFIFVGAAYSVMNYSQTFLTLEPDDYWCNIPELEGWDPHDVHKYLPPMEKRDISLASAFFEPDMEEDDVKHSQCRMYDVDWERVVQFKESVNSSWPTVPCKHGWAYNMTGFYPTIVTELDWVCDSRWRPWLAQSLFYLGAMMGSAFFGYVADAYGRLKAVMGTHLLAGIAGILTSFSNSFETFIMCRMAVGAAYGFGFFAMLILVLEFVDVEKRTWMNPLASIFGIMVVSVIQPWIALGIANWRWFAVATSAPMFLVLGFPIAVPESVRWLIDVDRVDEAVAVIRYVARINGKLDVGPTIDLYQAQVKKELNERTEEKGSCSKVLHSRLLMRYLLVSCTLWSFLAVVFDAHAWNFKDLGLDPYVAYSVSSLAELFGSLIPLFLANRIGRRLSTCIPILLASIMSLLSPLIGKHHVVWYSIFQICSRYFVNSSYNMFCQYQTEIFPTSVRSFAMGVLEIVGNSVTLIAPFIIFLRFQWTYFPTLIMGILCMIASLLTTLLPETMNHSMPDTTEEAEMIAKNQPSFFCQKKKKKSNDMEMAEK